MRRRRWTSSRRSPHQQTTPWWAGPDVVCTPHLGASTREAQEGVALEIAEAVVAALKVCLLTGLLSISPGDFCCAGSSGPLTCERPSRGFCNLQRSEPSRSMPLGYASFCSVSLSGEHLDTWLQ